MKNAFILSMALVLGLAGCASGGGGGGGGSSGDIQVLATGNHSSLTDPDFKDIHNAADLDAYLAKAFQKQGSSPKLDVDWTKQMVLTAFIGKKQNTGFRIRFLSVDETGDTVAVHVRIIIPCSKEARPEESEPYTIVAVPATTKPVNINDPEQEYQKC
ncbi:MAG TPA: hypothetical protein VLG68_04910 [Gammaproteobacteria bacterium]|nr:hypothetical protein [Gammaproteobacteria bacterium]